MDCQLTSGAITVRRVAYLLGHFLHLCIVAGRDGALVIAHDRNSAVGFVVILDLLGNGAFRLHFSQFVGHQVGRIVCTEDLCAKTRHVTGQMLVQLRGLQQS